MRCLLAIKLQFYKIVRKYGVILCTCSELTTQQTVCVYETIRKYEIGGPELEGEGIWEELKGEMRQILCSYVENTMVEEWR